jgi:hypothetical protein
LNKIISDKKYKWKKKLNSNPRGNNWPSQKCKQSLQTYSKMTSGHNLKQSSRNNK